MTTGFQEASLVLPWMFPLGLLLWIDRLSVKQLAIAFGASFALRILLLSFALGPWKVGAEYLLANIPVAATVASLPAVALKASKRRWRVPVGVAVACGVNIAARALVSVIDKYALREGGGAPVDLLLTWSLTGLPGYIWPFAPLMRCWMAARHAETRRSLTASSTTKTTAARREARRFPRRNRPPAGTDLKRTNGGGPCESWRCCC